ncbi:MAG: hypothetical protein M5U01_31305 [Ardenticatenaceae bacterium]|nr:hypothetical protein [Ardenticatenaceae bacterium]
MGTLTRRTASRLLFLCAGLLLLMGGSAQLVGATVGKDELVRCSRAAFSTEEDFLMRGGEPPDGNPWISDGDLLSVDGHVCARNADLLMVFSPTGAPMPDLGLDAVDIIDVEQYIVAFSTELDEPARSAFTAGDLLVTNGAVIPNVALVNAFGVNYDIGLDEVKFVGPRDNILRFLEAVKGRSRSTWLEAPSRLQAELKQYSIDIWFSTEGTALTPNNTFTFLDGDLLSAATGTIVEHQADLLPPTVPAGLPTRGVDFGLDAFAVPRNGDKEQLYYSTEIGYTSETTPTLNFTDGDVLRLGDGVVSKNWSLISAFHPAASDLGLDALFVGPTGGPCENNQITDVGGLSVDVADINTFGRAEIGYPTDHPFGSHVPFWGSICDDVIKFRVVFRKASDGPGAGTGIPVLAAEGWKVKDRNPITNMCTETFHWFSDAGGWYDGARYRDLLYCNPNLILTDWKSPSAPDPNALYNVWLEFDRGSGVETEPSTHPVRLDNTYPKINNLNIPGGACTTYSAGDMPIMVQGDFVDENFWYYRLSIAGDLYPEHYYSPVHYYDAVPAAANLSSTGTTPAATLVDLHTVTVFDLTPTPKKCAYGIRLWAYDRTIDGSFNPTFNLIGGGFRGPDSRSIFFDYAP